MTPYNQQYQQESDLFGEPYAEFERLIAEIGRGGEALDLGCGQGRDALMLAKHGYRVTGVDVSSVGVAQMLSRARELGLQVFGVVGDVYMFPFEALYDLVVLDAFLHFAKDAPRELELLGRCAQHLQEQGLLCLFVHKTPQKLRAFRKGLRSLGSGWEKIADLAVTYEYHERSTGFHSVSEMQMVVWQKQPVAVVDRQGFAR